MSVETPVRFDLGHQFKAREARDHLKDLLDAVEGGAAAVIRREKPVVAVEREVLDALLGERAPFNVLSSVTPGQVAFWLADAPVHAVGADLDEATEAFLDALVDYAESWFDDLRRAPNHAGNLHLVLRVAIYAGDRGELARAVFGD